MSFYIRAALPHASNLIEEKNYGMKFKLSEKINRLDRIYLN